MCMTVAVLQWFEECEPTPWWSVTDVFKSVFWFVTVSYIKSTLGNIEPKKIVRPQSIRNGKKCD